MSDEYEVVSGDALAPSFGDKRTIRRPPGWIQRAIAKLRGEEPMGDEEEQVFHTTGEWVPATPDTVAEVMKYMQGQGDRSAALNAVGRQMPVNINSALDAQAQKAAMIEKMLRGN